MFFPPRFDEWQSENIGASEPGKRIETINRISYYMQLVVDLDGSQQAFWNAEVGVTTEFAQYRGVDTIRNLKHAKRLWLNQAPGCGAAEIGLGRGLAMSPVVIAGKIDVLPAEW